MKVTPTVFVGINIFVVLIVLVLVCAGLWFFLNSDTANNETKVKADFTRLSASAQVYYTRLRFYTGVCEDIGVSEDYLCHDSADAYAIEANPAPGRFYCVDSEGFMGKTSYSKHNSLKCRQR